MENLAKIIFSFLNLFDTILRRIFNLGFLSYFKEILEKKSYKKIKIHNDDVEFFIPNKTVLWRVDTFFEKEPDTLTWIDSFKDNNKIIFWDIGANIGLYSIYGALRHQNIEVISFEPSTNNLRILSRNISINNLEEKIKINQFPLSDRVNEHATMNESEFIEGWSMGSFAYKHDFEGKTLNPKQKYKIFGTSVNFLLDNKILNMPHYIKIDVDGIEHQILKGANKYIHNTSIKSVLIEINENFKEQFDTVLKIMSNAKFEIKSKKPTGTFFKDNKYNKTFNYLFEKK